MSANAYFYIINFIRMQCVKRFNVVKFWFTLGFTISFLSAFAQEKVLKPSVDSTRVTYFNSSFDSLFLGQIASVDTSLLFVSQFDALSKGIDVFSTLSNAGAAHQSVVLNTHFSDGFLAQLNAFKMYLRSEIPVRYFNPILPFTEINYAMGSKKEQQMNVRFASQFAPRFFVGLDFRLSSSLGPYKENKIENNGLNINARYQSVSKRYGVLANFFHAKLHVGENGGIKHDSTFENGLETDRRIIAVNLSQAENKIKQSGIEIEQYFILSPAVMKQNDSVIQPRSFRFGRITHRLEFERNQLVFSEKYPKVPFYSAFGSAIDTTRTYDSLYQTTLKNRIYWSNLGYKQYQNDIPVYLFAGAELVNSMQSDSLFKDRVWQINPYGGIQISLFRSFFIDGQVKLITGNFANGNLIIGGGIKQYLGTESRNLGHLFFRIKLLNQSPSWFYEKYTSNHFQWENNFSNSKVISFNGGYQVKKVAFGGNVHFLDKYMYLGYDAKPKQTMRTIKLLHLYSTFHIHPGKFDIVGSVNYQKTDSDTLLHLPEFSARLRLAFSQRVFSNAGIIQPGIDVSWFSAYYADAYMPALRSFYLQNEKVIGNYPFIDVYLALKVKRARLFVQYSNLFGLMKQYNYYTTLHYPMRDPRLYFGVSWKFFK